MCGDYGSHREPSEIQVTTGGPELERKDSLLVTNAVPFWSPEVGSFVGMCRHMLGMNSNSGYIGIFFFAMPHKQERV